MSIVPPRVRTLLHLLFALFALSLVRFITTRTPSESSEEEDLRRKALVLAITTLSGLVVVRAEDLFEHEGPVDEAFKEKMDLMERSLGFAGVFFWGVLVLPLLFSVQTRLILLVLSLLFALLFWTSFLVKFVSTKHRISEKSSLIQYMDRETQKEKAPSLPFAMDASTRSEGAIVDDEEEPAETFPDMLSLGFLVGWSFCCLVISVIMTFWFKMDSPAITFIAPSVVSLLLMSFSRHQHRTPLILITSLILIFHILATASYTLSYVRDIAPVCNALVNSALGIIPSNPPIECELSRTLHFVSTLTLTALVVRLAVLHSTPMKSERKLSFLEFLESD